MAPDLTLLTRSRTVSPQREDGVIDDEDGEQGEGDEELELEEDDGLVIFLSVSLTRDVLLSYGDGEDGNDAGLET